eukprot:TRINITY_DN76617_c0_g1_i1.p1 TRINITY_DN76617_c0_g1~~TRINITY_DN76617_c0_g1_i1.p1  ORF type:complete len:716 (+),score=111.84 TRINITY_DN76617_c0_g1_i1:138-2150(+)
MEVANPSCHEPLKTSVPSHGATKRSLGAASRCRGATTSPCGAPRRSGRIAKALRADVFGARAINADGGDVGCVGFDVGFTDRPKCLEQPSSPPTMPSRPSSAGTCRSWRSVPNLAVGGKDLDGGSSRVAQIYGPGQQPGQIQLQQRQRQRQARLRRARNGWNTTQSTFPEFASSGESGSGGIGSRSKKLSNHDDEVGAVAHTAVFSYLRLFGLGQYARIFVDAGIDDLSPIAHMPDEEALDLLENINLLPGHRAKLLRAISSLHQAAVIGGSGCTNGELTGALRDEHIFVQLCHRMDLLIKERAESDKQNQILQEENHRLIMTVRGHAEELKSKDARLDQARARVSDLHQLVCAQTEQIRFLAGELQHYSPNAPSLTPEVSALQQHHVSHDAQNFDCVTRCDSESKHVVPKDDASTVAQSTDGTTERITQAAWCLAIALHNKILLHSVAGHSQSEDNPCSSRAAVFHDTSPNENIGGADDTVTACKEDIYNFLREVMLGARVSIEVPAIALIYVDRLQSELAATHIHLSVKTWRKLAMATLLLGSKMCSDDSIGADELVRLLPFSVNETNVLERALVQALDYNIVIEKSDYQTSSFMLRTLGTNEQPTFVMQPLSPERAMQLKERCTRWQAEFRLKHPPGAPLTFGGLSDDASDAGTGDLTITSTPVPGE